MQTLTQQLDLDLCIQSADNAWYTYKVIRESYIFLSP